jgi:5-methylcytosine-specific restriction endonuclease McrA
MEIKKREERETRPWTPHGLSYDPEWRAQRMREYYLANRAKILAARKARYAARREAVCADYRRHASEHRARAKAIRLGPAGERLRTRQRAYYAAHPAPFIERANLRRARQARAAIGTDRTAYRQKVKAIRSTPGLRCEWCRQDVPPHERHVDHVVPLAKGGRDEAANLCCACRRCNLRKADTLPLLWLGEVSDP